VSIVVVSLFFCCGYLLHCFLQHGQEFSGMQVTNRCAPSTGKYYICPGTERTWDRFNFMENAETAFYSVVHVICYDANINRNIEI
jgi:hypothetical protein